MNHQLSGRGSEAFGVDVVVGRTIARPEAKSIYPSYISGNILQYSSYLDGYAQTKLTF